MSTAALPRSDGAINCQVITPEKIFVNLNVDLVVLPLLDGEIGVLPGHQPLVGRLGYGEFRYKIGDMVKRYFVDGGFVQVQNNAVVVLTPHAIPVEFLDGQVAQRDFDLAASRPAKTLAEQDAKNRALNRARSMRHLAGKSS